MSKYKSGGQVVTIRDVKSLKEEPKSCQIEKNFRNFKGSKGDSNVRPKFLGGTVLA